MPRSSLILTLLATTALATGAQIPPAEFASRRAALLDGVSDGVVLVLGAHEPRFDYLPFAQARPFFYLTGFLEPEAALVMVKRGSERRAMLFVRPRDPSQEVWNGVRVGVDGVRSALGLEGRLASTLRPVLDSLLTGSAVLHVVADRSDGDGPRTADDQFLEALQARHANLKLNSIVTAVEELRGIKSASELERLTIAAEISARGHLAVMRAITPGMAEFEIQALAEGSWRSEGADGPGYATIVGSGPNSTTLHYKRNDRVAQAGEVIVMDMGASFDGYSADITRTVPVDGKFTPAQRAIYEVVLAAQKAAERQVRVGGAARAMTDSSTAALRSGLVGLGLIEGANATYDCGTTARPRECAQLSLYYMHGLGHGIGLDVHDPDQYYRTGTIGVGSAFTIEPGIYVRQNLLDLIPDTPRNRTFKARIAPSVARYANIGVRIEDDYLVTADGVVRPSAGVPREIDEIERVMALPRPARDPGVVSRYRRMKTGD